jgi:hypothetical protein
VFYEELFLIFAQFPNTPAGSIPHPTDAHLQVGIFGLWNK